MKNIVVYYISFIAPLILLFAFWEDVDSTLALVLLMIYVFVYRTWLDGSRLHAKGLILNRRSGEFPITGPE